MLYEVITHPLIAESHSIFTNESSYRNDNPMTDTKAIIHFSIILYELVNSIIITKIVVSRAPALTGIPKSIFRAMAPPNISASDVETDANIADRRSIRE